MPVRLVSEQEKLVVEIEGSKFFYRRIKSIERQNIIRKHSRRGNILDANWGAATQEMIKLCVTGWENVIDGNGEPIKYEPELIESLPDSVLTRISEAIGSEGGDIAKNSRPAPKS